MLTAIIVDDEQHGIIALELLIKKFVPDLVVAAATTNALEAANLVVMHKPDIVFLDINMPVLNGFELLEKFERRNFYLIFTTAHQEYGLKAIKQSATDYLLKPIGEDDIKACVERIREKIREKKEAPDVSRLLNDIVSFKSLKIPLPTKKSIEFVTPSEIIYIEADSNSSKVMLANMEIVHVSRPLKDYEQMLCMEQLYFMRIHNSFIININYVSRYIREDGGYVLMSGKKNIPISKHKKEEFLKAINFKTEA